MGSKIRFLDVENESLSSQNSLGNLPVEAAQPSGLAIAFESLWPSSSPPSSSSSPVSCYLIRIVVDPQTPSIAHASSNHNA
ncbi:hypothetical protein TIFTF001_009194 [Ficus carica]|uniref:Uncharacterized protein n=1 Tax=Ficus carica TaxID=3494 RepID=A0AA87ZU00_FICCA|nr:hypothetical protein TIFTF001_009194 [Ficus carica]